MAIKPIPLKYFFGATNTDASKKAVRIGDLIEASNTRQLNAGEYVQRGAFLADKTQTYERFGGGLVPISLTSPDGSQLITRTSDGRAYLSVDGENHRFLGSLAPVLAEAVVRSPAGASGENVYPLAKRAGQYSVHFVKADTFEVTKSDLNGSGIIERHRISMQAGNMNVSTGCRSLALISSDDFDDSALWVLWTNWAAATDIHNPGAVYARRIPYADLTGGSAYVAYQGTGSGSDKGIYLTSVSASVVGDSSLCAVAFCGFDSHDGGGAPVNWWYTETANLKNGPAINGFFYLDKTTGLAKSDPAPDFTITIDDRPLVGSGCCILTAKGVHEHHTGHWKYAFWTAGSTSLASAGTIAVVDVTIASGVTATTHMDGEVLPTTFDYPLDPLPNGATFIWHWLGSITGHETASGVDLIASCRHFWFYIPSGGSYPYSFPGTPSADLITTKRITLTDAGTWATLWTARGSWLACGYFRDPSDSEDYVVTGYCDKDEVLPTYHVRRSVDGSIVAQIAYGQAAKPGGVALGRLQTSYFLSDIQQPMLYGGTVKHVVLGMLSENTDEAVDVAEVVLSQPSAWQVPAVAGGVLYAPGPILNTCGGWQTMREAVPLLSPGRPVPLYWDSGEAKPISNGTVSIAVVYRFVSTNGKESKIARSAPYILNDALRLTETPNPYDFLRVPTLRHMVGAIDEDQFGTPSGPMPSAQIELYLDYGSGSLQFWGAYDNDPTVDYIDIDVTNIGGMNYSRLIDAIASRDPASIESLYTEGDALEASPPPMARAVCEWRNRLFAAFGDRISFTQEFAAGFSPTWNETLSVSWLSGTGPIIAICPIDSNYLAIFKQDAIGIISGPGPDGLGRGNYIVQTIPTNKGVTNPRSVINGADGCYFQDAATGRICIMTADLKIAECAPGAWNLSSQQIASVLHVESERQIWFATENAKIIVLDYKHKTESCPFGSVYTWDATVIGYPRAMCIAGGAQRFSRQGGGLGCYSPSTGYDADTYDQANKTAISMALETGEMQIDDLGGEFAVSRFAVLGEYVSPHSLTLTTYPSYAASGTATSTTVTAGPEHFSTRPPNCLRITSIRARLVSISSASVNGSIVYGAALKFVGFGMEVQPFGRIAWQPTSRTI